MTACITVIRCRANPSCSNSLARARSSSSSRRSTKVAIVTCGGLCPGLNNVIRSVYLQLHYHYGVPAVMGIRYGYSGFSPEAVAPLWLNAEMVNNIHQLGGTLLGTSRGPVSADIVVDFLDQRGVSILFTVGGDGTQRGAHDIVAEIQRRKLKMSVIGIPKTIDDDVQFVNRSFGYFTAIEKAKEVIDSAHVEAHCVHNGISIVKVMGRDSGFIAAGATVASQEVNFTLVPEVPFQARRRAWSAGRAPSPACWSAIMP